MTDYLLRARNFYARNTVERLVEEYATTLEALDKAEAERDALTQVARKAVDLISRDASANCGHGPKKGLSVEAGLALRELRALIQPEPDPLVEKIGALLQNDPACNGRVTCDTIERIAELARHGLAVKEVG
ncbi:hypothetical protein ACQKO5_18965 [Novosphingobium subterraneum]|uniref:hypothetical protein n=1 Tax=Novosphingobium subterraneum TaxID=48936 RepID=UPI003D02C94C